MSTTSHPDRPEAEPFWRVPLALRRQLLAALSTAPERPPHDPMTYEEFLDWLDEDTLAEWVDGEVIMASPANLKHQLIGTFLIHLLRAYTEVLELGVVLSPPFQMKLASSGREPDLIFLTTAHRDRLRPTYLDGPADLVVEIVSPESIGRDRGDKFYEYERAGIPEYWVIDPETERAEFWQLDAQGKYQLVPADAAGAYHSRALPGFWLRVAWLWQQPLPSVDDVLLEVGGAAYAQRLIERLRRRGHLPEQ
jgi:Uma2 family endonuclease